MKGSSPEHSEDGGKIVRAGDMVELSKDKMYVIGALLLLAEHETTGA